MSTRLNSIDKAIIGLAVPALGALAIDPLLTLADTAFVARLGTTELAALGVAAALLTLAFFAFNFLAFVTTPLVARAIGKGDRASADEIAGTALGLAVVLGLMMTVVVVASAPTMVRLMGAEGDVAIAATGYLRIRGLATTAVLVITAANGIFRGHKDTRTPLKVIAGINLFNIVVDPILIFALDMGLTGAALATMTAQWIGAVWFVALIRGQSLAVRPRSLRQSLPALMTLGRNGGLLFVRTAFLLGAFTYAASTATRIGPEAIAAHQLVAQVFILTAMAADALEVAAQALVAEESAGGDVAAVRALAARLLRWGLGVGVALMVLVGLGRYALPLLSGDPAVGELAVEAAGVAAALEPIGSLVFVADGIFVGLLALGTMALSTAVGAVAAIGLMTFTAMADTLPGVWWALGVFFALRGVVFLVGYRRSVEMAVRS